LSAETVPFETRQFGSTSGPLLMSVGSFLLLLFFDAVQWRTGDQVMRIARPESAAIVVAWYKNLPGVRSSNFPLLRRHWRWGSRCARQLTTNPVTQPGRANASASGRIFEPHVRSIS
jgi:hypothetical protein